jgi:hypothetical protein
MHLFPGDRGYTTIQRQIARRESVGISEKPETKRVYMTVGELRDLARLSAACPSDPLIGPLESDSTGTLRGFEPSTAHLPNSANAGRFSLTLTELLSVRSPGRPFVFAASALL